MSSSALKPPALPEKLQRLKQIKQILQQRQEHQERRTCQTDPSLFIDGYCQIQIEDGTWVPFRLWPAQSQILHGATQSRLVVWLKARQLGLTWLALALALHTLVFRPGVTVLLFSLRDEEATELLKRLQEMYRRLPPHLKAERTVDASRAEKSNDHEWVLPNGARAKAFPANRGDSYTAVLAVVDEADLVEDLDALMRSVKPTIDAGGRLLLLSRSNKSKPSSAFKRIYQAAKAGANDYLAEFLPWSARPDRDAAWYEAQKRDVLSRTGALDDLYEQYPATDAEALSPRSLDKRIAAEWLRQCYQERQPLDGEGIMAFAVPGPDGRLVGTTGPAIPGLKVYQPPQFGREYVIGLDPAEGNPTSDDSALTLLDKVTGEEVATLAGKFQPAIIGAHADALGMWYNEAAVLVERNNHGHAVLLWLSEHSTLTRLCGHDAKEGWLSSVKGKTLLYDLCADAFRNGETSLHSFATFVQLASIEGNTLRAPEGEHDDLADGYALGLAAITCRKRVAFDVTFIG